jgi:predicted ribosome quality control (RQC) complex YloA/Tae2 family protein
MDYFSLRKHVRELSEELSDHPLVARSCQLTGNAIGLILKRKTGWACLTIQLQTTNQGIWLSEKWEEVEAANNFCRALNRLLTNGRIASIRLLGDEERGEYDRVLAINIVLKDEFFGNKTRYRLICELTGRVSNALICDDEDNVLEMAQNTQNNRLKLSYSLPDSGNVLTPFNPPKEKLVETLHFPASEWRERIGGFSPQLSKELIYRLKNRGEILPEKVFADCIQECVESQKCYLYLENEKLKAISPLKLMHLHDKLELVFATFNQALLYIEFDLVQNRRLEEIRKRVIARLKKDLKHKLRLLDEQKALFVKYQGGDKYKRLGELVLSNIHQIDSRQAVLVVQDWDSGEDVKIDLDPTKTAAANAQRFFHLCKKANRGISEVSLRMQVLDGEIKYLQEQIWLAETASAESDLVIDFESRKVKKEQSKKEKAGKRKKMTAEALIERDNCRFYVGRNCRQNDILTFQIAKKGDWWFHANDVPGSHVILKKVEGEISPDDIYKGALLAAWFSFAKNSSKVPVDNTDVAFVKKIPGGGPGRVSYTHQKTMFVDPQEIKEVFPELFLQ